MLFLASVVAFTCLSTKSFSVEADVATVEIETADLDLDETVSYLDLLFISLSENWDLADCTAKPVTFSSSAGFHCDKATGRNICIQFKKLKFDC